MTPRLLDRRIVVIGAGTRRSDEPDAPIGNGRAVAVLARRADTPQSEPPAPLTDLAPRLSAHERPAPDLADYDQLLGGPR